MKKFIITLLWVSACGRVLAQTDTSDGPKLIFDIGINQASVNNLAFSTWVINNYHKTENPGISGLFDFAIAGKWDLDLHLSTANPYLIGGVEFGRRLTRSNSPIASYINLDYGAFNAIFNDLAPLHYTLTAEQQGQQMQLRSSNGYFGVTSRNYFNRFRFFLGKAHHAVFSSGFYVTGGYLPFHKSWYYGYWKDDGTDGDGNPTSTFEGGKVYGIPNINNFFIDAGLFVGIGF